MQIILLCDRKVSFYVYKVVQLFSYELYEYLKDIKKKAIKERVRQYDPVMWRREPALESSVGMYKAFIGQLREVECIRNTKASRILFRTFITFFLLKADRILILRIIFSRGTL